MMTGRTLHARFQSQQLMAASEKTERPIGNRSAFMLRWQRISSLLLVPHPDSMASLVEIPEALNDVSGRKALARTDRATRWE